MPSRKRKPSSTQNSPSPNDEYVQSIPKPPRKKQKKTLSLSVQERENLITDIVRFFLFKHASRSVVRRRDLMEATVKKTHAGKSGLLDSLMVDVQKRMRHLFGLEAVPVKRRIEKGENSMLFRVPDTEEEGSRRSRAKHDAWLVRLSLQPDDEELVTNPTSLSDAELSRRSEMINKDTSDAPRMGLLMLIYSLLVCSHERLVESEFWERLETFGIEKGQNHPVFGKVDQVVDQFCKELYLSKVKDEDATRDETDHHGKRTIVYYYTFGSRLHEEMNPRSIPTFLESVTGTPIPESIEREYDRYAMHHNRLAFDDEEDTQPSQPTTQTQSDPTPPSQSQS